MPKKEIIPSGVAFVPMDQSFDTLNVYFLLVPNLSMLAFASAIEPLRVANQLSGKPLFRWHTLSEDGNPVTCSNGISFPVDSGLCKLERGAHVFVCSGVLPQQSTSRKSADWVRLQWRSGHVVGGICTGAYTLAKAGILGGTEFTMHWENIPPFREQYPDLDVKEQLYVIDKKIMSSSGGHASTDLFLHLIFDRYGPVLSQAVLEMCIHNVHRQGQDSQQSSRSAALGLRNAKLVKILEIFDENREDPIDMEELSRRVNVSRRQIERMFSKHLGMSPRQYCQRQRLAYARSLLAETDLPIAEIAMASGFQSSSYFAKRFKELYSVSPYQFTTARHGDDK